VNPAPDVLYVWLGGSLAADLTISRRGLTEDSAGEVADATLAALAGSYAEAARAVPEVSPGIVADCETRTAILLRHR
jgi:hypothetical protein